MWRPRRIQRPVDARAGQAAPRPAVARAERPRQAGSVPARRCRQGLLGRLTGVRGSGHTGRLAHGCVGQADVSARDLELRVLVAHRFDVDFEQPACSCAERAADRGTDTRDERAEGGTESMAAPPWQPPSDTPPTARKTGLRTNLRRPRPTRRKNLPRNWSSSSSFVIVSSSAARSTSSSSVRLAVLRLAVELRVRTQMIPRSPLRSRGPRLRDHRLEVAGLEVAGPRSHRSPCSWYGRCCA